ncbi:MULTISPECIES: MFS transporter [Paraburkholderia]|uniref:MFS transporter n=1 Tax=Paraburkholderia dipogonis TaxID=1211383 RepID=A0A4Y8MGZ9_9BURK|nr:MULTISPECIES: MFS transporter [Paraburkholderia]RKR31301.1 putative MFS family arabinose efflux permease [Paraburkholderia sp. BL17N1]TFE36727.1 MFS transporter [Paraburkholderia dipogonis]
MTSSNPPSEGVEAEQSTPPGIGAQAWITLAMATAIYTLNVADRFIFSTLLQPIKHEFGLSDGGVASLNLALGLVLMVLGVPAGVVADRYSRRMLLGICAITFSSMTALSGMVTGMSAFVATRLGLGLGEAGCTPPSLTLIADRFPVARRGVAMTIFTLGVCGGSCLGTALAGSLSDQYGWRATMIIFGAFGLPLGAIAMLLVREPTRGAADDIVIAHNDPLGTRNNGLLAALTHVWKEKALLFVILGGATICTWGWGLLWWTPAFLVRTYGLTGAQTGAVLGKLHLIGGASATIFVAFVMHWLSQRPARTQIWAIAAVIACAAVASIFAYTASNRELFVLCLWLYVPTLYMYTGPTFSLINNMSPPPLRAKIVSMFLLATSFGNLILAPMIIGYCSDFFVSAGASTGEGLRQAMAVFAPLGLVAAVAYAAAGFCSAARPDSARRGNRSTTISAGIE